MSGMKMIGGMMIRRVIATTDMAATTAQPQVNPTTANLEAFLAPACARGNLADHSCCYGCMESPQAVLGRTHGRGQQAGIPEGPDSPLLRLVHNVGDDYC